MTAATAARLPRGADTFDTGEHPIALRWLTLATELAEEAGNAPLAGHVLRAMAHQAVDLKQPTEAVPWPRARSPAGRYAEACWREKALLGLVHARGLAAAGYKKEAAAGLAQAENDLGRATDGDEPAVSGFSARPASPAKRLPR
ncbi:hypothetical protein ACFV9D_23145 [Streptomyces sp. NPDC059875]|uniref:hypothetical protein n=1 Tax=unclassified Streptomyces TaxID=2593676 RepID=UPI00365BDE6D